MIDISGVGDIILMIIQGISNTFGYWADFDITGISYLSLLFSFIVASIIFSIVFAYIRSRVYNAYVYEKRNKK